MLRSLKTIIGYKLKAEDGEFGKVEDFYFDDERWTIRYLIVHSGNWLAGKRVLISPAAFYGRPDWASETFPVIFNKAMVEACPDVEEDKPVSRQKELELARHYSWPLYWQTEGSAFSEPSPPVPQLAQKVETVNERKDCHLRSFKEVKGYHIQAKDGEIGHVEDFIINDDDWAIRYVVVDTKNWLPGKKVLLAPVWAEEVNWAQKKVCFDTTREMVQSSPVYDPENSVNRVYEEQLYDYYGRPVYWR